MNRRGPNTKNTSKWISFSCFGVNLRTQTPAFHLIKRHNASWDELITSGKLSKTEVAPKVHCREILYFIVRTAFSEVVRNAFVHICNIFTASAFLAALKECS